MKTLSCAAALILAGTSFTSAAVIYDEGVSGDLSGAFATPTAVTISNGTNSVVGQVGLNGDTGATNGQDADYFTFTVGPGLSITSLTVDSYTAVGSGSGSFLGFIAGSSFGGQTGGDIDASVIFNAASGEILDDLGGTLGPGSYSFWIQETAQTTVDYTVTFTQIPEPATASFGLVALLALAMRRSR